MRISDWSSDVCSSDLVAGAYAAAFAEYLVSPESTVPVIGASGAVSAVLGAYAIYFGNRTAPSGRFLSSETRTVLWLAAAWIGLQLLIGLVLHGPQGGIAIWAHIGGVIDGLGVAKTLASLLADPHPPSLPTPAQRRVGGKGGR